MYTIRIRLIAYILLISHSLMSCYNPDIVTGQKQLTEKVQQEKQQKIFLITQEQEKRQQTQSSTFEQPISLSIHTTTHQEGDIIAKEPASLIKANDTPSLSESTQQAQKSSPRITNHFRGPSLRGSKATVAIHISKKKEITVEENPKKKQHGFFHPIFTNRQSCQIQFTSPDLQEAHIQDIHGRTFHLRVLKEVPSLRLQDLMAKGEEWLKYHIEVTLPEQDPRKQGYVRIGDIGLKGGGGQYSREREERVLLACRTCKRAIRTAVVWVEGYRVNWQVGPDRWVDKCDDCKKYDRWVEELREKAAREKREQEEREAREKAAREKREKEEREAREKAAREKREKEEREAREKAAREKREKEERQQRARAKQTQYEQQSKQRGEKEARESRERARQARESQEREKASHSSQKNQKTNRKNATSKNKQKSSQSRRSKGIRKSTKPRRKGSSFWDKFRNFLRGVGNWFSRLGKSFVKIGKALKKWVSEFGRKIFRALSQLGKYIAQGVQKLASQLWKFAKFLAHETWEWMKKAGKWIWEHKWGILIGVAIVAAVALAWWLIATYSAASGVGAAVGSAAKGTAFKAFFTKLGSTLLSKGASLLSSIQQFSAPVLEFVATNVIKIISVAWEYKGLIAGGILLKKLGRSIVDLIGEIPNAFPTSSANVPAESGGIKADEAIQEQETQQQASSSQKEVKEEAKLTKQPKSTTQKSTSQQKQKKLPQEEKSTIKGISQLEDQRKKLEAQRKAAAAALSSKLDRILQEIRQQTASGNQTTEESVEAENVKDTKEEEKAYDELVKQLTSPEFTTDLATEGQQAVKDLLSKEGQEKAQAKELADGLADLIKQMQYQHKYLNESLEKVHEVNMPERIQQVADLEKNLKATKASLAELCKKYNLPETDLTPEPPISKETLKGIVNKVLDATVPGSELIKILSGLSDSPQNQQEWLQLALDTALDFMPGGKIFKFLKGGAAKMGIKQIEAQILKVAAKKAKKAAKLAPQLLKKLQNILKPGGKVIGKQLGNDPSIRTIGKEEAQKIIKQLMDVGAKKVQKPGYGGTWYELPGGGGFGVRTKSSTKSLKHGTPNTIDLDDLGLDGINKLKY